MKKNLLFSLYVISLFTMSCSKNNRTQGENEIFVDFKSDKPMVVKGPEDLFNYSDYIDSVAYVPLETTDDCLMGDVRDILFVNNKIFLRDRNTIFIFSRDGKFISKVSKLGRGHGEYSNLGYWDVNPTNDEISVYSGGNKMVFVYSIQGDFLRSAEIEGIPRDFCVLPNGNYLFYTPDYMEGHYRGVWQTDPEGKFINQPLVLSGSSRKIILSNHNFVHLSNGQVGVLGPIGFDNIYHISTDTSVIAYHITTNVTIPKSVLESDDLKDFENPQFYHLSGYRETDNLLSFDMTDMRDKNMEIMYDKQTGKVYTQAWDNNNGNMIGNPFIPGDKMLIVSSGFKSGYGVRLSTIDATSIMQMPEDMRNQIAPDCTMDSNPVVIIYYYKH